MASTTMTFEQLARQDDVTSNATLALLQGNPAFTKLSESEGADIIKRDQEDDTKLAVGIQIAVKKGVLSANPDVSPVKKIDVIGKTADAVAAELISHIPSKDGNVIILQGLSGTGKGTTVKKLQSILPNCVTWSNGNVFRTFTYLITKHCEEKGIEFSPAILTPELLAAQVQRLKFAKFDDGFDVIIDGKLRVDTIANTELKKPVISQRVPSVAEQTQGEVVIFAAAAVDVLKQAGCNVILEGRAQTLQYIPSPYRFELVISDVALLGQRRAAQRVMAAALKSITPSPEAVQKAVLDAAASL